MCAAFGLRVDCVRLCDRNVCCVAHMWFGCRGLHAGLAGALCSGDKRVAVPSADEMCAVVVCLPGRWLATGMHVGVCGCVVVNLCGKYVGSLGLGVGCVRDVVGRCADALWMCLMVRLDQTSKSACNRAPTVLCGGPSLWFRGSLACHCNWCGNFC